MVCSDNFHRACTNASDEYYRSFFRSTLIAGLRGGEVYIATEGEVEGGRIVGVASWYPPRCGMMATYVSLRRPD